MGRWALLVGWINWGWIAGAGLTGAGLPGLDLFTRRGWCDSQLINAGAGSIHARQLLPESYLLMHKLARLAAINGRFKMV